MLCKDMKLQLVTLYIFSCLDNFLYYGLSSKLLSKLQVVLNNCVHFVYNVHRSSLKNGISVTALAKDLHIFLDSVLNVCMRMHHIISKICSPLINF